MALNVRAIVKEFGSDHDIIFTYRNDVNKDFQYIEEIQDDKLRDAACNFAHKVPCGVPADEMDKAVYFNTHTGKFLMGKKVTDHLTCSAAITRYLALKSAEIEDVIIKCNVAIKAVDGSLEVIF